MIDILKWKNQTIYYISIEIMGVEYKYFFRKIPYEEFKRIKHALEYKSLPEYELEMLIYRHYVISENEPDIEEILNLPAGIPTTLSTLILSISDTSTFPDEDGNLDLNILSNRIDYQRHNVRSEAEIQMMSIICTAFKGYTFESLSQLSFDKILQLFAASENMMLQFGILKDYISFTNNQEDPEVPDNNKENPKEKEKLFKESHSITRDTDHSSLIEEFQKFREIKNKEKESEETDNQNNIENAHSAPESDFKEIEIKPSGVIISTEKAKISEDNPNRKILESQEEKRIRIIEEARRKNKPLRTDIVRPRESQVQHGKTVVNVTGINYKNSGFNESDFEAPVMTEEEVISRAIQDGILPAGYDIMDKKKEKEREAKKKEQKERIEKMTNGKRRLTLRQMKELRESKGE